MRRVVLSPKPFFFPQKVTFLLHVPTATNELNTNLTIGALIIVAMLI